MPCRTKKAGSFFSFGRYSPLAIDGAENSNSIAEFVKTIEPDTPEYRQLKSALAMYRRIATGGGWPTLKKGPVFKPGNRDGRVSTLRTRLRITGDLDATAATKGDSYDPALESAVRKFQSRHGLMEDGIVAQTTLEELNVPVADRIRQIEVNLERQRWMDDNLGGYYIFVNVADQQLKVVQNGQTIHTARLVVGKPYSRTPVFSEKMKYIVLNPYWNVPPTIANGEYLPKQKNDPAYLMRPGIRLFSGSGDSAGEIDPS